MTRGTSCPTVRIGAAAFASDRLFSAKDRRSPVFGRELNP
ncbi:hypothetical protein HMPREF0043_00804 [Actinobaculum sp. oral taxon 183 str. F0552]|nr:hypothetical protein HMPREF0043_00804 [Actinobaculum sp. oral taxon 183 str. F0552]